MEQKLTDRPPHASNHSPSKIRSKPSSSAAAASAVAAVAATSSTTAVKHLPPSGSPSISNDKEITQLEYQVEQQRLLRLKDAQQVEAKAAKIKEWVTNKLRELEQQNQLLREQNLKCNQQLELLR